jgi:hypothetical protein
MGITPDLKSQYRGHLLPDERLDLDRVIELPADRSIRC